MKHEKGFDYLPAQRMRYLREELRRLQGRFALAEDPALIEALIYEQASLLRQQSACLREARELAVLTERYYERGYCRNGKYTL